MNDYVEYKIKDVWYGLNVAKTNFFGFSIIAVVIAVGFLFFRCDFNTVKNVLILFEILLFLQSITMYFKSSTYIIDKDGNFTFPRSDIENSILQILIQAPYWNMMRSRTVHISEVESIYIDGEFGHSLDVTGTFGSARLEFSTKQKRSEVRNAINRTAQRYNNNFVDYSVNVNS